MIKGIWFNRYMKGRYLFKEFKARRWGRLVRPAGRHLSFNMLYYLKILLMTLPISTKSAWLVSDRFSVISVSSAEKG